MEHETDLVGERRTATGAIGSESRLMLRWQDSRHLGIGAVDLGIVETGLDDGGLGIVRHQKMGADMGVDPVGERSRPARMRECEARHRDKDLRVPDFVSQPVDHHRHAIVLSSTRQQVRTDRNSNSDTTRSVGHLTSSFLNAIIKWLMRLTARVAASDRNTRRGFKLECMAGLVRFPDADRARVDERVETSNSTAHGARASVDRALHIRLWSRSCLCRRPLTAN
jgi:hypothetical protein